MLIVLLSIILILVYIATILDRDGAFDTIEDEQAKEYEKKQENIKEILSLYYNDKKE